MDRAITEPSHTQMRSARKKQSHSCLSHHTMKDDCGGVERPTEDETNEGSFEIVDQRGSGPSSARRPSG